MMIGFRLAHSRKVLVALVLSGTSLGLVPSAFAGPTAKPTAAAKDPVVELFQTAHTLFSEKKYDAALLLFRKAYEDTQSPNAHLMIGKCFLAQGKLPEAYDEFAATLREAAARAETEPKYAETRDAAAAEVAQLEPKIGKVVVTLVDAPAGARVLLGGVEVPTDKLGAPIAVLPGTVDVVAEGLSQGADKRQEQIKAGETKVVVFGAKPQSSTGTPPSGTEKPVSGPDEMTGGGLRKAGFAVLGLGVVGMGMFAIGGIQGNAKFAQLEQECGGARCTDPKYADIVESGKTMDLVANIGLGVGIAGIVAGTVMVLVGGPKAKPKTTDASLFVSPGQTVLQVRHVF